MAPFAIALTLLCVTGVANAINIIDGFNGLASMCVPLMLLALVYVAFRAGDALVASAVLMCADVSAGTKHRLRFSSNNSFTQSTDRQGAAHKATSRPMEADRAAQSRVVHGGGRSALATNRPTAAVGNPCSTRCTPRAVCLTPRHPSPEGVHRLPCPCGDCQRRLPWQGPRETRSPQGAARPRRAPRCSARPCKLERLFMSFPPRLATRAVIAQRQGVCP